MNDKRTDDFFEGKIGGRQFYYCLNPDHTYSPCTLEVWLQQIENDRHLADEEVLGYRISTVWLGIDHNHFGYFSEGAPWVFETMVFKGKNYSDVYMQRYTTWDEAMLGHQKAKEWVLNGCKDED